MTATSPARRVILYARVSITRDDSKSVDDQLQALRTWAEREGWTVAGEYRDDGVSASRYANGRARPGWQRAQDEITGGRVDALLVWEISRATRDRAVFAALFAACVDAGVLLGTGGRLHDLANAEDGFVLDLGAALAVRESAKISERTRRASESRAASGRPAGSVLYGYRRVIDPDTGRTVGREKHPEQAPIVAEVVRRLLAREHANAIAKDLNRRGVPVATGDRWMGRHLRPLTRRAPEDPLAVEVADRLAAGEQPGQVAADLNEREVPKPDSARARWQGGNLRTLALRATYAGLRVHRGQVLDGVRGTWPAIITEAEHHQLVAMFDDPARNKFRNPTGVRYLGTGIYRCGRESCDGRMRVMTPRAPKRNSYQCRVCHRVSRLQEPLDALVERALVTFLSRPDVLAQLTDPDDADARLAAEESDELRGRIEHARQLLHEERLSLESFADLETRTLARLRDAERRARPPAIPSGVANVAGPEAEARWKATALPERRAILDALLTVTILPMGWGGQPFDPATVQITRRRPGGRSKPDDSHPDE